VLVHRGEAAEAVSRISACLPRAWEIGEPQTLLPTLAVAALGALARGDLDEAATRLDELEDEGRRRGSSVYLLDYDLPVTLAIVGVTVRDRQRAEALLGGYEPWTACGKHALLHGRAVLAESAGLQERAAAMYADAAAGWREWGSVPFLAYALAGLGRCGADLAARAEADEIFARIGAIPIAVLAA
jgi:ATP/maltotriose-dependent transcriptional regulator MalT